MLFELIAFLRAGMAQQKQSEKKMTLIFYAQPYNIDAEGFYFRSVDEYDKQASNLKTSHGEKVEEFELQFIDGELIDCEFAKAFEINQANFSKFFDLVNEWDVHEKIRFIVANGECGYGFNPEIDDINQLDVEIYDEDSVRDLAIRFVEEGLFGEIPKPLEFYIDYDAIARDLAVDYSETTIAGEYLIYRCS